MCYDCEYFEYNEVLGYMCSKYLRSYNECIFKFELVCIENKNNLI